jgi:hypothetical protein
VEIGANTKRPANATPPWRQARFCIFCFARLWEAPTLRAPSADEVTLASIWPTMSTKYDLFKAPLTPH